MRNLDTLLANKFRLRKWLFRSARTVGHASLIAFALNAPVWAQDDVTITTPTTLTGDDEPLDGRILTISSNTADNASLSLTVGTNPLPPTARSRAIIVGSLSGEFGSLSLTHGSQLTTYGNYDVLGTVAGQTIYSGCSYLGLATGSSSTAIIEGPGSSWSNEKDLYVGYAGTGELTVANGAQVSSTYGVAAYQAGSQGTIHLSGNGTVWNNSLNIYVGWSGQGELEVENGAVLNSNGTSYVGILAGGSGLATISGTNSVWNNSGASLIVGHRTAGELNISNGGLVRNGFATIGSQAGGQGTVNVSGPGSHWVNSKTVTVGNLSTGELNISNQGRVEITNDLYVGFRNQGNGTVSLSGNGASLSATANIVIGYGFEGGTSSGQLNIASGGTVSNVTGFIGYLGNATGTVAVEGTGSSWNATETIIVGSQGAGSLLVSGGGTVTAKYLNLGGEATGTGALFATDSGTQLQIGENFTVGWYGNGQAQLAAGATAATNIVVIGDHVGSQGALSITGLESKLSTAVWTFAGIRGSSNLEITNGGQLESSAFMSAVEAGSQSQLSVRGANSLLVAIDHYHGNLGTAALSIEDGGEVRANNSMHVGRFAGTESTVNVSGIGSKLSTTNDLNVGYQGEGSISVENGGALQFGSLGLGGDSGGSGSLYLTGPVSRGEGGSVISVGGFGTGELRISDQAELSVGSSFLGLYSGSGSAVVESGGKWNSTGDLFVGNQGSGQLEVLSGGQLTTNTGAIGRLQQSSGSVVVSGPGSQWNHSSSLNVGLDGTGSLTVINGGTVANGAGGYIGVGGPGVGSVSVSNAGSSWNIGAELVVGDYGAGSLAIADGGQVLSTNGYVATRAGSSGVVSVLGTGSTWNNGFNLFVGGADGGRGGSATLVVSGGGLVTGSQTLINYDLVEVGIGGTVNFNHVNNFGNLINNGIIDASLALHGGSIASGNGTVIGLLSVNDGGILAPGNSVGLMSAGAVAFNGGGAFQLEFINASGMLGTGWDGLDLSGALTVNATSGNPFLISVSSLAGFAGFSATSDYSWEFITTDGGINGFDAGKFAIDASGFVGGAYSDRFSLATGGNSLRLNFTAVPEPGTFLPLGLMAFGLLARSRKRNANLS